ncbi:MAG: dihydroorotate dehydrogenase electron transfer subunit [Bacillota bacterium]|nr:dihydroorotate dehydrogenase electron transfer subunit [Bacillota bacterium]
MPSIACEVTARRELAPEIVLVSVHAPAVARAAEPGQFVFIRVGPGDAADPFLRRPMSLAGIDASAGQIDLVIRAMGRGTRALAGTEPGRTWDVIGPLGRGYPRPAQGKSLLVGGGTGAASLMPLAQSIVGGSGPQTAQTRMLMLLGARSSPELWAPGLARERGLPALFATDDGTAGHPGLVTDLLRAEVRSGQIGTVYACGPVPMLRAVQEIAVGAGVPCYISLEQRMACGVGACRGCSWPRSGGSGSGRGYVRVCRDGPVFSAKEVLL